MKFKIGNKVIYYQILNEDIDVPDLINYRTYTITNVAFYMKRENGIFYSVDKNYPINWYKEENFLTKEKERKLKLKKIQSF